MVSTDPICRRGHSLKMQVWLHGDVLWCFLGSNLSMVVVSFDRMLYIFVEDSSCLHQIAGIGYSKLSVLNWVSLIPLFTVFLWTISWANFLKNYLFNLVFIAQPIGLKAFLSCLSSSSPFYEPWIIPIYLQWLLDPKEGLKNKKSAEQKSWFWN